MIFHNGNILTMDPAQRRAEALAIVDERILAVGTERRVTTLAGPDTKKINLNGATVLPGFIDCHTHLIEYALLLRNLDLRNIRSIEEMKREISQRISVSTGWVLGRGWDQEKFKENRYPSRRDLDESSADRPVMLRRICGHICVANSQALHFARITKSTRDPPGGAIDRDSEGEPTGIMRETAVDLIEAAIPSPDVSDYEWATSTACEEALKFGLTSVHCITSSPDELRALLNLRSQGELPIRFYVFIPSSQLKAAKEIGLRTGFGDEWVRFGGIKVFTDGSLGARTAALEEPYSDDTSNTGVLTYTQDHLNVLVSEAHELGIQVAIHAIGDRAVRFALTAIEHAKSSGESKKDLRHRIEHASVLNPKLIEEIRDSRTVASIQPRFVVSDVWLGKRLGQYRSSFTYPFSTMQRKGIKLIGGSDCPVEPMNPLSGVAAAVKMTNVPAEDALAFYTRNAAYASFEEDLKGTITPGKLADFAILAENPIETEENLDQIPVLMTVVGGRVAFNSGKLN